ncbi:uncharacterized protein FTOL_06011 [Fusarium torulosum]|uniref:Uncharacterized protein n=1 Tax=Fusarium torulosum TaxID=33205 RepID=A0AAE8M8R1_9HYPO|nr:uncharacterized protein FTOL_06011 [Fusarium torulosum]
MDCHDHCHDAKADAAPLKPTALKAQAKAFHASTDPTCPGYWTDYNRSVKPPTTVPFRTAPRRRVDTGSEGVDVVYTQSKLGHLQG